MNPFLDVQLQQELVRLVATMLLHASAISQINVLVLDCTKLEKSLLKLGNAVHKGEDTRVLCRGVVNLADAVATSLHTRRHYIKDGAAGEPASFDPRMLVFEFIRSLILREGQVQPSMHIRVGRCSTYARVCSLW